MRGCISSDSCAFVSIRGLKVLATNGHECTRMTNDALLVSEPSNMVCLAVDWHASSARSRTAVRYAVISAASRPHQVRHTRGQDGSWGKAATHAGIGWLTWPEPHHRCGGLRNARIGRIDSPPRG